jgi:hypothetical protein
LIGLSLAALAEPLIFYGAVLKQYSFDALVTLVLLIVALPGLRRVHGRGPSLFPAPSVALLRSLKPSAKKLSPEGWGKQA